MSARKLIILLFLLSVVGFGAGYLMTNSYNFGICFSNLSTNAFDVSCHEVYERVGNPLYYGMSALAIVFIILLFLPSSFSAWKKFAKWFVPLAALLFIFYPEPGSGDFFSPYPEQIFRWVSILYIVLSVVIIARSVIKQKRTTNT